MTEPSRVRISGPLAQYAPGFAVHLADQGYALGSAGQQVQLMAHLSRWLATEGLSGEDCTPERVHEFLVIRRKAGLHGPSVCTGHEADLGVFTNRRGRA